LKSFVAQAWHVLDPSAPVEWAWYLTTICSELEAVSRGEVQDLLINLPPGMAKSLLVSILWPAWEWLRDPSLRFVAVAGGEDLAIKDGQRMREVVDSDWYQRLVKYAHEVHDRPLWKWRKDQNQKRYYRNNVGGHRQAFGLNGKITGNRGDIVLFDEPHQVGDVVGDADKVAAKLTKAWTRSQTILSTRVYDHRKARSVAICQRVHQIDFSGRKIARMKKGRNTRYVCLPMRFDPSRDDIHPDDPRTEPGELLDPIRIPQHKVDELAAKLDEQPGQADAQLDQRPIPPQGALFKAEWWRRYTFDPQRPPDPWDLVVVSIDANYKKTKAGSFASITAWGLRDGKDRYLLGEVHARLDYRILKEQTKEFLLLYLPNLVLVEEKANGAALISDLQAELRGVAVVPVVMDKHGDKWTRAQLTAPSVAAGNYYLPDPDYMPSVGAWESEVQAFPFGPDDRVDGMSQLELYLRENFGLASSMVDMDNALSAALDRLC
jgi:predicted phage terminase large subunit-like protein